MTQGRVRHAKGWSRGVAAQRSQQSILVLKQLTRGQIDCKTLTPGWQMKKKIVCRAQSRNGRPCATGLLDYRTSRSPEIKTSRREGSGASSSCCVSDTAGKQPEWRRTRCIPFSGSRLRLSFALPKKWPHACARIRRSNIISSS